MQNYSEWLELVLGPLGALVLAVSASYVMAREIRKRHAKEVDWLRSRLEETDKELDAERTARVQDAKDAGRDLLELSDRFHVTLQHLDTVITEDEDADEEKTAE